MRKFLSVLALGLSVAACATIQNPVGNAQLSAVENSYGAALAVFVGYRDACAQRLIPPSCRTAVKNTQPYIQKTQGAIVAARNFVRSNPTLDAARVIFAAENAVNDFKLVQTQNGVK